MTERYRPTRAGIINLWDYRDEEFSFVDGWLVLRGPNGSGKTKALELLFPFLFDGRIDAARLNPFASRDRGMKSNLLYRGQEVNQGYVWMEFERDGAYQTIGIGLRGHRHQDKVPRWHFTTRGRIGVDFGLLDEQDRPLSKKQLTDALGAESVVDTSREHREKVNAALFGLAQDRYEQMLDLVITLRRPQLAKDLKPDDLSDTLSAGLRPLDDRLVAKAARSFEDMEQVAAVLEGLKDADEAVTDFLGVYTTYLRTHSRAAALDVATRLDTSTAARGDLADLAEAVEAARTTAEQAEAAHRELRGEPERLRGVLTGLKENEAYKSVATLDQLRARVGDLATARSKAEKRAADARKRETDSETEVKHRRGALSEIAAAVEWHAADMMATAEASGITWEAETADPDRAAEVALIERRSDITAVEDAGRHLQTAVDERERAERRHGEAEREAEQAEQTAENASVAVETERDRLREATATWAEEHRGLFDDFGIGSVRPVLDAAVTELGHPDSRGLRHAAEKLTANARDRRLRGQERDRHDKEAIEADTAGLGTERAAIEAEHDDAPPAPRTRTADRTGQPGAPLWRAVDFAEGIDVADEAAIEAALEAAGVIDAWIGAEGPGGDESDVHLRPLSPSARPAGLTLADYLVPEPDAPLPHSMITDILASIAVSDNMASPGLGPAIDRQGRFANTVLLGRYTKPEPEFIGASARAARRAARIDEIDTRLSELAIRLGEVTSRIEATARLLSRFAAALDNLPLQGTLLTAVQAAATAAGIAAEKHRAVKRAKGALDDAIQMQSEAAQRLHTVCTERALPADRLETVRANVQRFESAAGKHRSERAKADGARARITEAEEHLRRASEERDTADGDLEEAAERWALVNAEYESIQETSGAEADEILRRIAATEQAIKAAAAAAAKAEQRAKNTDREHAKLQERHTGAESNVATAAAEAAATALRLRPFAQPDRLKLLGCPTDLRWPPAETRTEESADLPQAVTALHQAILVATEGLTPTENSLKQSATRLSRSLESLVDRLPASGLDYRVEWDTEEGVFVVKIADDEGLAPVVYFADRIRAQLREQEALLSEAEQRVLEDTLLTELALQIHDRVIDARDLVRDMDKHMRTRKMSSGLTVGVSWTLDDKRIDDEQRKIAAIFDSAPAQLGPRFAELRSHFSDRIKQARAESPETPYRELMAEVLDYRRWRRFSFTLYRPGGKTQTLTRSIHSLLSGGEQSVSLHLPLFAAANAVFASARDDAPRMIALDEAFAGVDEQGRSELMSLAGQFDLQLFMTGFDLWATFESVPGVAHYDLAHSALDNTVSSVLMVWNGEEEEYDADGTLAAALGSPETRRVPSGDRP
ncbi:TIGR02680 family protein [Glycomyces buryatensis]|uniref:TIGR02680 family protein n=1 Tax=Glycomyces buryatensis TaxID=2570927 RepID=A0A4V4HSC0_9ACTN|nr:TIGR02680 family protein [Glycomyces buryatensis]THV41176.1 TIGR02680 family protein [Glycomyces buryatensis]